MSKVPSTRSEQAISRDHEHVDKISTTTTLFVLAAIALLLYAWFYCHSCYLDSWPTSARRSSSG